MFHRVVSVFHKMVPFINDLAVVVVNGHKLFFANAIISYYGNDTHEGITPINLSFLTKLNESSDAGDVKDIIEEWMKLVPDDEDTNWVVSTILKFLLFCQRKFYNGDKTS